MNSPTATTIADLGPGLGDVSSPLDHGCDPDAGVLLPPRSTLAVAQQRQHQRAVRNYFEKGTDLRVHTAPNLARVADELNRLPRNPNPWNFKRDPTIPTTPDITQ